MKTLVLGFLLVGCRGGPSEQPPIHLQRNMFTQDKGRPQRENSFFADHRVMRLPVEGTVSTTAPLGNDPFYKGKDDNGEFVKAMPVQITAPLMARGQERYNIYCSPCHDRTGAGNGVIIQRAAGAIVKPPSYHEDRLREASAGQLFDVITNGVRTMPAYAYQVPTDDRWAIVAYIRALQRSQRTTVADVPEDKRGELR